MYSRNRFFTLLNILFQSLLLCCVVSNVRSSEKYHFASIEGLVEQEIGRIILPEVYKKLGINIVITAMPGKRAEKEATSGVVDGEIMRIWSYGEENPSTIRVPTPYYYLETTAFVKNKNIVVTVKADLAKYSLVKIRGVKHTNNITEGLEFVQDVETTCQMMRFLLAGRADIALTNTIDGTNTLKRCRITGVVPSGKPLAVWKLYHYLHVDHKDLVPRVDTVIKKMIASGEMAALIKKAELSLNNRY